ncbi:MAG: hypothetical protein KC549_04170 [Myxococcales bacterium]|nr:hypothetical protein [Myxococcales bacterium]
MALAQGPHGAGVLVAEYHATTNRWDRALDIVREAAAPMPRPGFGFSVAHRHREEGTFVAVAYGVRDDAGNDAVVVLERRLGPLRRGERAWHIAHEVPVGDGIGELGRCMSGSFCLRSRQGLMLVLSEQGILTCLAEWTGIPYGWEYRPSGDPSPRRLPPGRA